MALGGSYAPSPLNPTDDVPAQAQCVYGIEQPSLRAFEHVPLINQIVENGPALRDELIKPGICVLNKTVLP